MRYFFGVTYKGTSFHGWQTQANAIGVQQVIEEALTRLFREKISIIGSGRTDTGVHCVEQYFHADLSKPFDPPNLVMRLNSLLNRDIAIRSIRPVLDDASARYDAIARSYEYRITRVKNPLLNGLAFYFFKELDLRTLNRASALLVGMHDFESFSKVKTDVNHFLCDVKSARWRKKGDLVVFTITANRFLRGMVRSIVGTLLDVASGKTTLDQFKEIIKSRDRRRAGMNVPPEGLYLMSVKYPKKIFRKQADG